MQKTSYLLLILLIAVAVIGAYHATLEGPAPSLFIRFLGLTGFLLLCVSLLIGPLTVIWPKNFALLVEPRRAVGLATFTFILTHALLALMLYFKWDVAMMLSFLPLSIGALATFIFLLLAATSSDYAVKALGVWWKRLHKLNYLAFLLAFVHFIYQSQLLSGKRPLNYVEMILLALGACVIIMQVAGFLTVRKRLAKTAPSAPSQ